MWVNPGSPPPEPQISPVPANFYERLLVLVKNCLREFNHRKLIYYGPFDPTNSEQLLTFSMTGIEGEFAFVAWNESSNGCVFHPVFWFISLTQNHRFHVLVHVLGRLSMKLDRKSYFTFFDVTLPGDLFSLTIKAVSYRPVAYCDNIVSIPGVLEDDLNPTSPQGYEAMTYVGKFLPIFLSNGGAVISLAHLRLLWLRLLYEYLPSLSADDKWLKELPMMTRISLQNRKKSAHTCTQPFFSFKWFFFL